MVERFAQAIALHATGDLSNRPTKTCIHSWQIELVEQDCILLPANCKFALHIHSHFDLLKLDKLENNHGSGDHWILMAILDRCGFRTNSPTKAVDVAEKIITTWYRLQE